ncbi:MAG TPA: four helix bundle protein [Anaerolineae bacterium]|nr:four helix bundle protein [Anaerolineae bacterium]HQK12700.1 four helix bundle protein [Anaerolineae bacterium]
MGEPIKSFRDLKVWQKAMDAAMEIYALTLTFPKDEKYSLSDQIRRSSRSVAANIAEAWRKRRYPAHWISKLSDSEAEAAETQTHLEFALRCRYIDQTSADRLNVQYEEIFAMLSDMSAHPEQWRLK